MASPTFPSPTGLGRRRATAVAIAGGLVLLVAFTVFVLRLAENAVRSEAEGRVRSTAQLSARLVAEQSLRFGEVVNAYGAQLQHVSETGPGVRLRPADRARLTATLRGLRQDVDGITLAAFTDARGRLVASVPASVLPPGTDLAGRDWYRGVQRRSPYISRAYLTSGPRVSRVTVAAVRVRDAQGRTVGVLSATESRLTQAFTDDLGSQVGADVVVTDQAGTVVGQTGDRTQSLISRAEDPLVADALAGHSGVRLADVDGQRTVSGFAPVPGTGWTVLARVPESKAFKDVARLRLTVLAGSGVVAFLLLWMVPLLAGRLNRARDALGVSEAFQRDLLPSHMPAGVRSLYHASERRMLLGGDFIDAVATPDGGLAILVGDVCGHGPRAAALGASLRAGWRTLAGAGEAVGRLDLLNAMVEGERRDEDLFATVACAVISPDGTTLSYAIAGHPPPLLMHPDGTERLEGPRGAALGLGSSGPWPVGERELPEGWSLAVYTDGLIEAHPRGEDERLGVDGLIAWATDEDGRPSADRLVDEVTALAEDHPHGLDDDLALVVVDGRHTAPRGRSRTVARSMGPA